MVYCDSRNDKLLWKAALERALKLETASERRPWWQRLRIFLRLVFEP